MPKLVAVVGGKHSGKTTVIEHLIDELTRRGYHVAAVKEMVRVPTLDTPEKETDRYAKAGAETVVAVPKEETVVFIKRRLTTREILPHLAGTDFAIFEGFESEPTLPKIVVAKTAEEVKGFMDGSVIAVSGLIVESHVERDKANVFEVPLLGSTTEARGLADLIEKHSFVAYVGKYV